MDSTITLALVNGVATVYKIGDDWQESYWQRRVMEDNPAKYGGLFLTHDAAMKAARELAAELVPHLVGTERTEHRVTRDGVTTEWTELYAWVRANTAPGATFTLVSTPIETTITDKSESAVVVEWRWTDKIIVMRQVPAFVMVDGVRYEGPPTTEVVAESPTFRRTATRATWHGRLVEDIVSSHTIYVTDEKLHFATPTDPA